MTEPQPVNPQVDVDLDLDKPTADEVPVVHRRFRLRGEVFDVPHVSVDVFGDAVAKLDEAELKKGVTLKEVWHAQADHIEASLRPDDLARFKTIRERPVDSLAPSDLRRLYSYIWEAQTGRPTKSAQASSPGPESSAASSKVESGSVEVVRPS